MAKDIILEENAPAPKRLRQSQAGFPFMRAFRQFMPNANTPSQVKIDVENYTKVDPKDNLQEGDEYYAKGHWLLTNLWKFKGKLKIAGNNIVYRRPLKKP